MGFFSARASSFSVFSLCLARSSFCMENGENSEKSNHMPSATSHSGLEFLTKFLKMSKSQNRCTRGSRYRSSTTVPSVAVTVFAVATGGPPVGNGGHRWAIGGTIGGPSMKGPQRFVTLVETEEKFYKHRHTCTDHLR